MLGQNDWVTATLQTDILIIGHFESFLKRRDLVNIDWGP